MTRESGGRKWTHLGMWLFILGVRMDNGLHPIVEVTFNYAEVEVVGCSKRVCSSYLTVDYEGTVTMNNVSYDVLWNAEEPPARGNYTMSVHSTPVFDAQPTSSEAHNRLSITFVVPGSHCSVCDVDEVFRWCMLHNLRGG